MRMGLRAAVIGLFMLAPVISSAQTTTSRMFDKMSHDFGYVARGAHVKTKFRLTNTTGQPMHIRSVTPSCPICSIAQLGKNRLQPGESVDILAGMKTTGFTNNRSVSVTVVIDQPYFASYRLTMKCFSRSDIVINPGEIQFGTVERGKEQVREIKIEYAGKADWKIESINADNDSVELSLKESHRGPSRSARHHEIGYVLTAKLKSDAQPGPITDRISLIINDRFSKTLDLMMSGSVRANVLLEPSTVDYTRNRRFFIRGTKAFKVVSIVPEEGPFRIDVPVDSKRIHFLDVQLDGKDVKGRVSQKFRIVTDMEGEQPLVLEVHGQL